MLKSLVDNAQMPPDEALSIDLGSLLHVLVGFISRFNDPASYRVRIKFCSLVCSVCERSDALTLRKDDLSRNRILDTIMEWFQDPLLVSSSGMSIGNVLEQSRFQNVEADTIQLQYDINMFALRTAVQVLDRLKLQSIDTSVPHNGDDLGHAVSRLFIRYSYVLLRALDVCQSEQPVRSFPLVFHHSLMIVLDLRLDL